MDRNDISLWMNVECSETSEGKEKLIPSLHSRCHLSLRSFTERILVGNYGRINS